MKADPMPTRPFESVSADLFACRGHHFLVYADRYSGYPMVKEWMNDPTAKQVIEALSKMMQIMGFPCRFRSDGGPQFKAAEFQNFLRKRGIVWRPSSPYFPSSNGHAEIFVKKVKATITKLNKPTTSDEFCEAIMEIRNTPRADGISPNQVLFGRQIRTLIPTHYEAFKPQWKEIAEKIDRRRMNLSEKTAAQYNEAARDHRPLRVGDKVRIQDHVTRRWDKVGHIVSKGKYRDYLIKLPSGRSTRRNRRFLRKYHETTDDDEAGSTPEPDQTDPGKDTNEDRGSGRCDAGAEQPQLRVRRSERSKKKTVRFGL